MAPQPQRVPGGPGQGGAQGVEQLVGRRAGRRRRIGGGQLGGKHVGHLLAQDVVALLQHPLDLGRADGIGHGRPPHWGDRFEDACPLLDHRVEPLRERPRDVDRCVERTDALHDACPDRREQRLRDRRSAGTPSAPTRRRVRRCGERWAAGRPPRRGAMQASTIRSRAWRRLVRRATIAGAVLFNAAGRDHDRGLGQRDAGAVCDSLDGGQVRTGDWPPLTWESTMTPLPRAFEPHPQWRGQHREPPPVQRHQRARRGRRRHGRDHLVRQRGRPPHRRRPVPRRHGQRVLGRARARGGAGLDRRSAQHGGVHPRSCRSRLRHPGLR